MKKLILLITLAMLTSIQVNGQWLLQKSGRSIPESVRNTLATRIAVVDYQAVDIDLNQTSKNLVSLSFFNHQITLLKERVETRNQDDFSWFASDGLKMNQGILTIKAGDIQGIITVKTEIYRIETFENLHIITKIDQSKYPPEGCSVHSEHQEEHRDSIPNYRQPKEDENKPQPPDNKMYKTYPEQQFWNYECKLRVLVLYTTAAKNAVSNVENLIQLAIDETNFSYTNSGINFQMELVYMEETGYQESGNDVTDLEKFTLQDGVMDNVHNLKEVYSADVCVLIEQMSQYAGYAAAIKSCGNRSFCLVSTLYATGNFTFAHEIGHLIGARHDPAADPGNIPYAYGHGFIGSGNSYRTIMGVASSCSNCTRIPWWSNPNILRNGQPMGTTNTHDNARVLNAYIPNIMSHRPTSGSRVVIQADIDPTTYGVVYHTNKIETTGTVNIANAHGWGFIAGNEVTLNPGFETADGSVFEASIMGACGTTDNEQCNFDISFDQRTEFANKDEIRFSVFPNPVFEGYFTIEVNNSFEHNSYEFDILNSIGKTILPLQKVSTGIRYYLSDIPSGLYLIRFYSKNNTIQTIKIILP